MKVLSRMNTTFRSSTIRNGPTGGRAASSTSAAANVSKEASTLSHAVVRSSGSTASHAAATPGMTRIANTASEPASLIGVDPLIRGSRAAGERGVLFLQSRKPPGRIWQMRRHPPYQRGKDENSWLLPAVLVQEMNVH